MIELIVGLIILVIALYFILIFSTAFTTGMAYAYWGLSIGMAPVLWLLMIIGAIIGFICALKNAFKALKTLKEKE